MLSLLSICFAPLGTARIGAAALATPMRRMRIRRSGPPSNPKSNDDELAH
jgi:hypothetical protein